MQLTVILSVVSLTLAQFQYDDGLKKACEIMNGQFLQRNPPSDQATVGDRCTMTFQTMTSSEEDAAMFCRLNAPWRLNKAVPGKQTTCEVEATLMCKAGWRQMFGHCFRAPGGRKRYTRADAEKLCKDNGAQVTTLHHKYHVGVFKRFFSDVSQTWIRSNEAYDPYTIVLHKGGSHVLAFTGKTYTFFVSHNSLVLVDPSLKFQVICEYKPPATVAEVNSLAKRYDEIYFKSVSFDGMALVRSSSHYTVGPTNLRICQKVMKALQFDFVQPFYTYKEALSSFDEAKTSPMVTRTGAEIYFEPSAMKFDMCAALPDSFHAQPRDKSVSGVRRTEITVSIPNQQKTCDNLRSLAFVHHDKSATTLNAMSDSFYAPVWCYMGRKRNYKAADIPGAYATFNRSNGEVVAHRIQYTTEFNTGSDDYSLECKKNGDTQSAFDSWEELRFLVELMRKANYKGCAILPAARRPGCSHTTSFDDDGPCSRGNIIKWLDSTATNNIEENMWWNENGVAQPNKGSETNTQIVFCRTDAHDADSTLGFLKETKKEKIPNFCQRILYPEEYLS